MVKLNNDDMTSLVTMMRDEIAEINTSLPAEIVSYKDGVAVVKPVGSRKVDDGTVLEYPNITNVPVSWPRFAGDKAGIKGPISKGDRCMLMFSQRALDEFMGGGDDTRMYDLTDAVAVMGVYPVVTGGNAANNDSMIMYFGDSYIRITENGELVINARVVQTNCDIMLNAVSLGGHTHGGVDSGKYRTWGPE